MLKTNAEKKNLIRELVQHAELMIQAGMSQSYRTCGSSSCACQGDPERRHGPHTYLTFRTPEGKSTGMYVSPENLPKAQAAKQAWDEFWDAATRLAALNREALREQWQQSKVKARTKR